MTDADDFDDDELQPAEEHVVANVPEEVRRHEWLVWAAAVRRLIAIDGLTATGLDHVRRELRPGGSWGLPRRLDGTEGVVLGVPDGFGEQAAGLLDLVTRRLVELRPDMADYYANAGLAPVVPDDVSALDGLT